MIVYPMWLNFSNLQYLILCFTWLYISVMVAISAFVKCYCNAFAVHIALHILCPFVSHVAVKSSLSCDPLFLAHYRFMVIRSCVLCMIYCIFNVASIILCDEIKMFYVNDFEWKFLIKMSWSYNYAKYDTSLNCVQICRQGYQNTVLNRTWLTNFVEKEQNELALFSKPLTKDGWCVRTARFIRLTITVLSFLFILNSGYNFEFWLQLTFYAKCALCYCVSFQVYENITWICR